MDFGINVSSHSKPPSSDHSLLLSLELMESQVQNTKEVGSMHVPTHMEVEAGKIKPNQI